MSTILELGISEGARVGIQSDDHGHVEEVTVVRIQDLRVYKTAPHGGRIAITPPLPETEEVYIYNQPAHSFRGADSAVKHEGDVLVGLVPFDTDSFIKLPEESTQT
jgi:hypothetical protein